MSIQLTLAQRELLTTTFMQGTRRNLVYGGLTDGKFLNGLQFGVSYKVSYAGAVAMKSRGTVTDRVDADAATVAGATVLIDQEKLFNIVLANADAQQGVATIGEYLNEGQYSAAMLMDSYFADQISAGAGIVGADIGVDGTPIAIDETNVIDYATELIKMFLENDGVAGGASLVMPTFMGLSLQNARAGAGSEIGTKEQSVGVIDRIHGVNIAISNNTGAGATSGERVHIFEKRAVKWRDSMTPIWAGYSPEYMSDIAQGSHLYGSKVVIPSIVGCGYVTEA